LSPVSLGLPESLDAFSVKAVVGLGPLAPLGRRGGDRVVC